MHVTSVEFVTDNYKIYTSFRCVQWTNLAGLPAFTCLFLQRGSGAWTSVSSSARLPPVCSMWLGKVSATCI